MRAVFLALVALAVCTPEAAAAAPGAPSETRFVPVEVVVDVGATPLAAYQIEVTVEGDAKIAGVEGGEGAFKEPPHYDPKALMGGRIILAAFTTEGELPKGKVRVCTLHMQEKGPQPAYVVSLKVAAASGGHRIDARATLNPRRRSP